MFHDFFKEEINTKENTDQYAKKRFEKIQRQTSQLRKNQEICFYCEVYWY